MPRKRAGPPTKGQFSREDVEKALAAVRAGRSLRGAARDFNLKKSTLQRYMAATKDQEDLSAAKLSPNYACRRVFTNDIELELMKYLVDCAQMGYGLDTTQVRKLAFQLAKKNDLKFPECWNEGEMAGVDWLIAFRKRQPTLSLRKPEPCSTSRASAFTQENMKIFFDNLKKAMDRHPGFSDGSRVFNLDEIGTTTVGTSKRKILAPSGVKQIPQSKTQERGTLVTTLCIIGANGTALPPAMVFPRVNFQPHMLLNAYPGTLGLAAPSGWMNGDIFPEVMKHFVKNTNSSKENPSLLIVDNDASHLSIEALDIAKGNGVTLLTLIPHTSHKTQPLDVAVFSPFRNYYDNAIRSWTMANPGQRVTIYHIAGFVRTAMEKTMSPGTILSGFRKCGIFPFNPEVFTEADFLAASPFRSGENFASPAPGEAEENAHVAVSPAAEADLSAVVTVTTPGDSQTSASGPGQVPDATPGTSRASFVGPYSIRGLPKQQAAPQNNRRSDTRKGRSMIPTDTPEKLELEAKKAAAAVRKPKRANSASRRAVLPAKKRQKKKSPSPSSSEAEDDPVPLADSDASETWCEVEDEGPPVVDPSALDKLSRDPKEGDYILLKHEKNAKKKTKTIVYRIAKVISDSADGNVEVSTLKKSQKIKNKFIICDPPEIKTVLVKHCVMILPKPDVSGTKRQKYHISFNLDFSLVPLE